MIRTMSPSTAWRSQKPERFVRAFREAEINGTGEELFAAVDPPGREKLLGTDRAERLAELRAQEVLPAIAPRQ